MTTENIYTEINEKNDYAVNGSPMSAFVAALEIVNKELKRQDASFEQLSDLNNKCFEIIKRLVILIQMLQRDVHNLQNPSGDSQ
jgi:hypothetical protein